MPRRRKMEEECRRYIKAVGTINGAPVGPLMRNLMEAAFFAGAIIYQSKAKEDGDSQKVDAELLAWHERLQREAG